MLCVPQLVETVSVDRTAVHCGIRNVLWTNETREDAREGTRERNREGGLLRFSLMAEAKITFDGTV
jgi:hypothetical protein